MAYTPELTEARTGAILTLDDLKHHCRIDNTDDDDYCQLLIDAVRDYIETRCNRTTTTAKYLLRWDQWPACYFQLQRGPIQSVESIKYLDADGVEQSADLTGLIIQTGRPAQTRIYYGRNYEIPNHIVQTESVQVDYTAGEGDDDTAIQEKIKHVARLLAASWYEYREALIGMGSIPPKPVEFATEALLAQLDTGYYG